MQARKILAVDDDPALLRAMRLTLVLEGFDVETAVDGADALGKVVEDDFDLVLLDLQMPRMDGRTFYRQLRSQGYDTPVLILSAFGADSARTELQAQGAVNKPFDPSYLIQKVKELLAENGSRPEENGR